jgi:hypothetical protein
MPRLNETLVFDRLSETPGNNLIRRRKRNPRPQGPILRPAKCLTSVGSLTPIAAAAAFAAVTTMAAFSEGGMVGGGYSATDNQIVKVRSGEGILTPRRRNSHWRRRLSSCNQQPVFLNEAVLYRR